MIYLFHRPPYVHIIGLLLPHWDMVSETSLIQYSIGAETITIDMKTYLNKITYKYGKTSMISSVKNQNVTPL